MTSAAAAPESPVPNDRPPADQTLVLERGPHHRQERFIQHLPQPDGKLLTITNDYTVLGAGMHYLENGRWLESQPDWEEFKDGFVARHTAHRGILSRQLFQSGAVDVVDPDGVRIRATPSMLVFRDRETGDAVELARIIPTEGRLASPTTVIYPAAFDRLNADVVIKWSNGGMECDVVLRAPPKSSENPGHLGANDSPRRLPAAFL